MMDALLDLEHIMTQNAALSKANLKLNVFNSLVRQYRDFTNRSDQHQQHLTLDLASMILMKNHHTKLNKKNKLVSIQTYLDGLSPSPSKILTIIKT
jgi:hypothetical protein